MLLALSLDVGELERDPIVGEIIDSAIEVHRVLGPGMLESAYAHCLSYELIEKGIEIEREVPVPLRYKNIGLDCGYRLDLLVAGYVIVEVKAVERLLPIHTAQVMSYLRLTRARRALLLNFNGLTLKAGLRSFIRKGVDPPEEKK